MELKTILEFPDYKISESGEVYRYKKRTSTNKGRKLTSNIHKAGFQTIRLYRNGTRYHLSLARLVYITFIGELKQHERISFIDGNKLNTHYSNLFKIDW